MSALEIRSSGFANAQASEYLARAIRLQLEAGKRVLWLVPGGSSIAVASVAAKLLRECDLSKLSISLTDERFGDVGHADSNWRQLKESGFSAPGAQLYPVLKGEDLRESVRQFGQVIHTLLEQCEYKIGFFGVGADGHAAGILPQSVAATSKGWADGYDAGTFTRITITPVAIEKLDEAVIYAIGEEKRAALEKLQTEASISDEPAQCLKLAGTRTLFTDLALNI